MRRRRRTGQQGRRPEERFGHRRRPERADVEAGRARGRGSPRPRPASGSAPLGAATRRHQDRSRAAAVVGLGQQGRGEVADRDAEVVRAVGHAGARGRRSTSPVSAPGRAPRTRSRLPGCGSPCTRTGSRAVRCPELRRVRQGPLDRGRAAGRGEVPAGRRSRRPAPRARSGGRPVRAGRHAPAPAWPPARRPARSTADRSRRGAGRARSRSTAGGPGRARAAARSRARPRRASSSTSASKPGSASATLSTAALAVGASGRSTTYEALPPGSARPRPSDHRSASSASTAGRPACQRPTDLPQGARPAPGRAAGGGRSPPRGPASTSLAIPSGRGVVTLSVNISKCSRSDLRPGSESRRMYDQDRLVTSMVSRRRASGCLVPSPHRSEGLTPDVCTDRRLPDPPARRSLGAA